MRGKGKTGTGKIGTYSCENCRKLWMKLTNEE
jgi:hypothetical protein